MKSLTVVIPIAGRGSRFAVTGVTTPKPLIQIRGEPMVAWALKSLDDIDPARVIFIALKEHDDQFGIAGVLKELVPYCEVVLCRADEGQQGQLSAVLLARPWIDDDQGVLIGNADTLIKSDLGPAIHACPAECRGIISVFDLPGDRWSFARTDESGRVVEVAEKVRISNHASTGYYYFASGREMVEIANAMIASKERTKGEYYVMPAYQHLINQGLRIDIQVAEAMWDLGTPESLANFEANYSF